MSTTSLTEKKTKKEPWPAKYIQNAGRMVYTFDELRTLLGLPDGYALENVFVKADTITIVVAGGKLPGVEVHMHEVMDLPLYKREDL